jgi:hypothetical protein
VSLTNTKILSSHGGFDIDTVMSSGLTLRVNGGALLTHNGFTGAPNVELSLVASATNFVEVTGAGVIQSVASDFTSGNTNLYEIATSTTQITGVKDWRFSPEVDPDLNLGTAGSITGAMFAGGAGVAALLAAGLGASARYDKTTNATVDLLAAHATKARAVVIMVHVDEVLAAGIGTEPTFEIGEVGTLNKFAATSAFTNAAAGAVLVFAGTNTATKTVQVTGTAGVGVGTGAITVTVLAIPTT